MTAEDAQRVSTEDVGISRGTVDKVIGWTLNLFVAVALSVGAYFFSRLDAQLAKLDETLRSIQLEVVASRGARDSLGDRLGRVEALASKNDARLDAVERAKR